MPNRADLQALIERVEKATGPDRELDVDIVWAIEPDRYRSAYWNGRLGKPGTTLPLKLDGLGRTSVRSNCPALTASVDAALAFMERVLPGWSIQLYRHPDGAYATLYRLGEMASILNGTVERHVITPYYESIRICDAHLQLAIVAATLRAVQQENE